MLALAIAVGLLVGLSLGTLGGGGSILTVPALVYLLHQTPHAATTGSLLIVGVSALAGAAAHSRSGNVRMWAGLAFGALGIGGSYAGSRLSASVDPDVLLVAFAALMLVAAAAMLRHARETASGEGGNRPDAAHRRIETDDVLAFPNTGADRVAVLERPAPASTCSLPSPSVRIDPCRALRIFGAATAVGLLTGFFGVGGGFVIVPALVLGLGFTMPVAIGTSLLVIAVDSGAALLTRLGSHASLDWPLLAVFTLVAIAGSLAGKRVAARVDAGRLASAFVVLLVGVAGYTLVNSLSHLL